MRGLNTVILVDGMQSRKKIIDNAIKDYWSVNHITDPLNDEKLTTEETLAEATVIVISTKTIQTASGDPEKLFSEIYDTVDSVPIVCYGEDIPNELYETAYRNDVNSIVEMDTGFEDNIKYLREEIREVTKITARDIQDTTFSVAQSLMSATDDELDTKINWALQSLGEKFNAVDCVAYDCDTETDTLTRRYAWNQGQDGDGESVNQKVNAVELRSDVIQGCDFPGYNDVLSSFSTVYYDEHTTEADTDLTDGHGTLIAIPIIVEWQLHAVFVMRTQDSRHWTEKIHTQLESIGELILHTDQRRQQRVELEQQNEQLEQFNSVISHDLQNPLSIARGYVEVTQETGDISELDVAYDAIIRMENMINELLTLARQGKEISDTESNRLHEIVTDARNHVTVPDGEIRIDDVPKEIMMECDSSRLQELFENLFRNAVDHCGDDVTVTVKVTSDDEIVVADNGPGIPEPKREKIFEHGYTENDGTGFGLAIVQRIIDAHGWGIAVNESELGGAEFVITPKDDAVETDKES